MNTEFPWPWPLAPVVLVILVAAAAAVVSLVRLYVIEGKGAGPSTEFGRDGAVPAARLPVFEGFLGELLPTLAVLWGLLIALYLISRQPLWWAVLPWATVTTLMLWPVGWSLDRTYFSYRSPLFVLGVLSMAYIIGAGLAFMSPLPFMTKSWVFWGLAADLTVLAIIPSLPRAIGRPIGMFFRPDLLFGDGRVLCCGTLAMVLGLRYMIGTPAKGGAPWPVPAWDWYAILVAISLGFIPLIAVRGLLKLLLRLRRLRDGAWGGWGSTLVREGLLVLTILAIGYGFHNAFLGRQPFTWGFLNIPAFWEALAILLAGAFFLVVVRGAYKKHVGDPFIAETLRQTWIKQILYVVGALILFYGLMSLLHTDAAHYRIGQAHLRTLNLDRPAQFWIGFAIFLWGLVVLLPFRVLAQHYQRQAIVSQMAAVILPTFPEAQRRKVMSKFLAAVSRMPASQRRTYLVAMNRSLASAPEPARAAMTRSMLALVVDLEERARNLVLEGMAASLGRLSPAERATRMSDMVGAVTELPEGKRGALVAKMASMLG